MGKSTLGNFLLDPDEHHMLDEQTFVAAKDNKPMTQEVRAVTRKVCINISEKVIKIESPRYETLTIIDTPGLNESAEKDSSHMIQIIEMLYREREIRACILVIKFNTKIDAQYKATMEYYGKLLPGLFDRNVIIVMTDFATDNHSEKVRQRQGIDVAKVKKNTIMEICQCSNSQLTYKPPLFTIDCLPRDTEMETSLAVRTAIIDYIFETLTPVSVADRLIAKTTHVKQKHAQKLEQVQGEISDYKMKLKQVHQKSEWALDETLKRETEINEIQNCIKDLTRKRDDLDKPDDVVAESWSIEESWKMFRWFTREFNVESPYQMTRYTKWTNGKCEFKEIIKTTKSVKGKVEGELMRGVYASVTVYTEKREKYAREISRLHDEISKEKAHLKEAKAQRDQFKKEQKEHIKEIQLLEEYIKEKNSEAIKWTDNLMGVEETRLIIEELKKS